MWQRNPSAVKSKQYCSPKRMISQSLDTSLDPRFVSCMQSTVTRPMISLTNKSCKLAGSLLPSSQILHSLDVLPRCSHNCGQTDRSTNFQLRSSLHLGLSHLSPSHRLNLDTYEMVRRSPRWPKSKLKWGKREVRNYPITLVNLRTWSRELSLGAMNRRASQQTSDNSE